MKRTVLFVLGALLLGMCMAACDDGGGGGDGMSEQEWFDTVKIGMTLDQVVAVVGRPPDTETFSYSGNRKWPTKIWRFGNAAGTVGMGTDGKVFSVGYSPDMYG